MWRDRNGLVHLLDGLNAAWCDQRPGAYVRVSNTKHVPTCLPCIATKLHFDQGREVVEYED